MKELRLLETFDVKHKVVLIQQNHCLPSLPIELMMKVWTKHEFLKCTLKSA